MSLLGMAIFKKRYELMWSNVNVEVEKVEKMKKVEKYYNY